MVARIVIAGTRVKGTECVEIKRTQKSNLHNSNKDIFKSGS